MTRTALALSMALLLATTSITPLAAQTATDGAAAPAAEETLTKQQRKELRKQQRQAERQAAKAARQAERRAAKAERQAQNKAERQAARRAARQAAKQAARQAERQAAREAAAAARAQQQAQQQAQAEAEKAARQAERRAARQAERQAARKAARQAAANAAARAEAEREATRQARRAERRAQRREDRREDRRAERRAERQEARRRAAEAAAAAGNPQQAAPVIVPNNTTAHQQRQLRIAEQARREEQRRNRRELLGAGLVGLGVGAIISGVLDGEVVADQGDRIVVRQRDGSFFLRKDENELLRRNGTRVRTEQLRGGRSLTTARRPNGVEVVTLRNQYGDILHRIKRYPNGDEVVLIDNRNAVSRDVVNYERTLPPVRLGIPLSEYIVDAGRADRDTLEDALTAHPVEEVEREYSLREIRENNRLREKVRRVDLDAITFQTGSARVTMSQVDNLDSVGSVLSALVKNNPGEVFLVEGYTDAVGGEVSNLVLSDRRAEAIAKILVEIYDVPPENLITQGYGERYLKVPTLGPSQANRRVTVRRITPLLTANR